MVSISAYFSHKSKCMEMLDNSSRMKKYGFQHSQMTFRSVVVSNCQIHVVAYLTIVLPSPTSYLTNIFVESNDENSKNIRNPI